MHLAVLTLSALDTLGKFEELYGNLFMVKCGKERPALNSHEFRYLIEEINEYVIVMEFPQNLKGNYLLSFNMICRIWFVGLLVCWFVFKNIFETLLSDIPFLVRKG